LSGRKSELRAKQNHVSLIQGSLCSSDVFMRFSTFKGIFRWSSEG